MGGRVVPMLVVVGVLTAGGRSVTFTSVASSPATSKSTSWFSYPSADTLQIQPRDQTTRHIQAICDYLK